MAKLTLGNTSGGATKISGLYGIHEALYKNNIRFDYLTGVSAGSILSLVIALGKFNDENKHKVTSFKHDWFFDKSPVNKRGKISLKAALRAVNGASGLGSQNNLKKTLSGIITLEDFKKYKDEVCTEVYVGTVDFKDASSKWWKVRDLEYDEYLSAVEASSNIPVFVEPELINGNPHFDGGVRSHIGTRWLLEKAGVDLSKVEECYSIFSRPEDYKPADLNWQPDGVLSVLDRTIEIMNIEISKRDEETSDKICEDNNIKHNKIFLPRIMKSLYDTHPGRLKELYSEGFRRGLKYTNR
jgi:predicted acylesterase/phospholipase RssA